MKTFVKWILAVLGCAGVVGLALWWFADHRRGVAWAVSIVRDRFPDVAQLSPASLDAWLRDAQRPAPQLVDARSKEEFGVSPLPGARHIDPESAASTALAVLDPTRPVVIYCAVGYRSSTLARRLQSTGRRDVWNLEGGIFAWANDGFQVVRGEQAVREVHPYRGVFSRLLRHDRRPR